MTLRFRADQRIVHLLLQPGKPHGELFMFEHTGSRFFPFRPMMDLMTLLTRKLGPEMNRQTVENVIAAGFTLKKVTHVYMDVVKTIHAVST